MQEVFMNKITDPQQNRKSKNPSEAGPTIRMKFFTLCFWFTNSSFLYKFSVLAYENCCFLKITCSGVAGEAQGSFSDFKW